MAKTNFSPTFPMFPGDAAVVTPSDTVLFDTPSVVYVGGSGDVAVLTAQGSTVIFPGVLAGTCIPCQVLRVNSTGTSATNLRRVF